MSIECGECEHDLRGSHAENCSRRKRGQIVEAVFALLEPLSYDERQRVLKTAAAHWPSVPSAEATAAHLTPSGQVAEDEAKLARFIDEEKGVTWIVAEELEEALSRLAAKAQGYEAMKAERDAAVADTAAVRSVANERIALLEEMLAEKSAEHAKALVRARTGAAQRAYDTVFAVWGDAARAQQVADDVLGEP